MQSVFCQLNHRCGRAATLRNWRCLFCPWLSTVCLMILIFCLSRLHQTHPFKNQMHWFFCWILNWFFRCFLPFPSAREYWSCLFLFHMFYVYRLPMYVLAGHTDCMWLGHVDVCGKNRCKRTIYSIIFSCIYMRCLLRNICIYSCLDHIKRR